MLKIELIVEDLFEELRVDKYIAANYDEVSRSELKYYFDEEKILVNGKLAKPSLKVFNGDIINILERDDQIIDLEKEDLNLEVIYEDDDVIVVNKANGVVVHPAVGNNHGTLVNGLMYHSNSLSSNNGEFRPGIVHRLDKETSGLLLFTKSYELKELLSKNWNTLVKERGYIAIVEGKMPKKEDKIISWLKETDTHLMYDSHKEGDGIKAITNYKVIKESSKYSLLDVTIETGRKNQIRVAMNDLGHPIVGDDKYGKPSDPIKRLGLHASTLKFKHPITKEILYFKADIPAIFKKLFK